MSSYEPLSSLPAGSSGNAADKSGPKGLPASAFGSVTTPPIEVIQKRPSYVIVNVNGTYAFNYDFTASVGTSVAYLASDGPGKFYTTGSVVVANAGPVRLDIQPTAWRQTDAAGTVGDITFVYQGGL